jgi:ribosome-binding ATPase YchF (GTP1/OBG family)
VALQVGIVGLQNAGKTTLFRALTGAAATGRDNVGMAAVPDPRLRQLADTVNAKKVTPAAIRVADVPGTGAELLGNLRQVDLVLAVLDGWSGTRDPDSDYEELMLELLAADRDHVARRHERVAKQAKSGEAKLRAEVSALEALSAHLDTLQAARDLEGIDLPSELELLTTKPILRIENGPNGIDLKLEAELAELNDEEAAAFREGESALGAVVRELVRQLNLITFFTAGDKETRAWPLRRGETALDAAAEVHSDIARGFIRAEVIRWDDLVRAGSHNEAKRQGLERVESKTYVVEDGDVINVRFNV